MNKQSGAALFVALILLAVLMVIGVASVRNSTFQEKMSVNVHQLNWAKNAAESGIASLNNLASSSPTAESGNVLYEARLTGKHEFCVNSDGAEGAVVYDEEGNSSCNVYMDGDDALTTAKVVVETAGCIPSMCLGTSLGEGIDSIKCQNYKTRSFADAAGTRDTIEWWGFEYSATCRK